jgi:hypothetical protein
VTPGLAPAALVLATLSALDPTVFAARASLWRVLFARLTHVPHVLAQGVHAQQHARAAVLACHAAA